MFNSSNKPSHFLEVGVLEGVTSRNICEMLNKIHNGNFMFSGIDLFGKDIEFYIGEGDESLLNNPPKFITDLLPDFKNPPTDYEIIKKSG